MRTATTINAPRPRCERLFTFRYVIFALNESAAIIFQIFENDTGATSNSGEWIVCNVHWQLKRFGKKRVEAFDECAATDHVHTATHDVCENFRRSRFENFLS